MEGFMGRTLRSSGLLLVALSIGLSAGAKPLTAVLKLKERVSMQQLAQNVQDPHSSHYQRPYEPAEIRQLAGPSDSEYKELLSGLQTEGFTIVSESPTPLLVTVRGESRILESLFSTRIEGLDSGLHRQLGPVSVPAHLALVQSVTGLDNTRRSHTKYHKSAPKIQDEGGIPQSTIKTGYGFDPLYAAGFTGKGQHIAVATYDGFTIDNVVQFYKLSGLQPVPSVDQVQFNGAPTYSDQSSPETELDSEFSGMIAPGSSIHVFASATNDDAGELQMFTAILDDNRAKIVNYSWGDCEPHVTPQHRQDMAALFARAVAQGVNIVIASGDSGSDSCRDGSTAADWPAAAPYVVAVGGTTFSQDQKGLLSELAWSGSGGGISTLWDLPAWQNGLGGIFTKRSYPDVAFNADPQSGQAIYTGAPGQAGWVVIGGTSMSAPQWSGFLALVGEARQKLGKGDLGYLSPLLYKMSVTDLASSLHDVTSGSNGAYQATAGWDAVTGWGSMQADALLNYLKAL